MFILFLYSEDFISLNINIINPMLNFKKAMSMYTSNYNVSKQPLIKQLSLKRFYTRLAYCLE
jgi:hypothetical protein